MKTKITRKDLRASYGNIISIGYCDIQTLLRDTTPDYYLTRVEGWAADVYVVGRNTCIVTGYAPTGNINPPYELQAEFEARARVAVDRFPYNAEEGGYDALYHELELLRDEFVFCCITGAELGFKRFNTIRDNLTAFVHNFGFPRLTRADYGRGVYVHFPASNDSWIQYCEDVNYLNGWLYGVVQGVNRGEFKKGVVYGCFC